MRKINEKELYNVIGGGATISSILNSLSNVVSAVLSIGRTFGSSIRRISSSEMCGCR